jgi:hypothetical protein
MHMPLRPLTSLVALVSPPAYCPGCYAKAGVRFPVGATTRHCGRCLARMRRSLQAHRWNADRSHQVAAGKARARRFTLVHQRAAGNASWDAFSARWRAGQGIAPLSAEAARKYVTPGQICGPLGVPLSPALQATIHRAWCVGQLVGVLAWLCDDPPPDPDSLWVPRPD